jgi:hypothetical protein
MSTFIDKPNMCAASSTFIANYHHTRCNSSRNEKHACCFSMGKIHTQVQLTRSSTQGHLKHGASVDWPTHDTIPYSGITLLTTTDVLLHYIVHNLIRHAQ